MWALRNPTSKGNGLEDGARVLTSGKDVRQECKEGAALERLENKRVPVPRGPVFRVREEKFYEGLLAKSEASDHGIFESGEIVISLLEDERPEANKNQEVKPRYESDFLTLLQDKTADPTSVS
ncbi:hypothetical protein MG293_011032 [Ovis ammon polii]|uniref:Uncharacterized protein n=1 Tax=Ovis ammon polii TaxID=230172 RepID=A0AAD4Y5S0_OVIAM|nr:hypothetical protein MG293_011032 [Ovis ammon polii]